MNPPKEDIEDRKGIWDASQMFWMDTDPATFLSGAAEKCVQSKYTLAELEAIFWNEVRPAVSLNMRLLPAPEWTGFEIERLIDRILMKNKYGRRLPIKWFDVYSNYWWRRLRVAIISAENSKITYSN